MDKQLTGTAKHAVRSLLFEEILTSFPLHEVMAMEGFEDFWTAVDAKNGHEDNWESEKEKLKPIYKEVYDILIINGG